ncbi:MAG: glycosyltransferase family 4 protein [Candidatus Moranbacteria bacterium]|nr:glycosyltransferase family 4 protein [Candidatus Moranbacteria bacterium]
MNSKLKTKSPQRILMLNYEFPPLGGGGGVASKKLAKGFIHKGYEVDYVTSWKKGLKKKEKVEGISVFRVRTIGRKDDSVASNLSMVSYLFFGFLECCRLCLRNKYAFVNTQFVLPTGPLGFLISKIFRLKNILSIHGGDIYDPSLKRSPHRHRFLKKIVQFLFSQADVIVAQSSNTKNNAISHYSPKNEIKIIPLPYEKTNLSKKSRDELGLKGDEKYIVGIGRMVKRKGFEYFIEALSKLDKNVKGIIIGEGPEKEKLLKLADKKGAKNKLILPGFVSDEEKFHYLCNSDVFVLSSLHEGFGIVLQEAMEAGLPIVATNNGGQVDFIEEGKNGYLVEPKNAEKLAEKIEEILFNKDTREKMTKNNLKKIDDFNLENIADLYLKLAD